MEAEGVIPEAKRASYARGRRSARTRPKSFKLIASSKPRERWFAEPPRTVGTVRDASRSGKVRSGKLIRAYTTREFEDLASRSLGGAGGGQKPGEGTQEPPPSRG